MGGDPLAFGSAWLFYRSPSSSVEDGHRTAQFSDKKGPQTRQKDMTISDLAHVQGKKAIAAMPTLTRDMIIVTFFGALAGLACYAMLEWITEIRGFDTVTLGASVFSACFFGGALTMTGPVHLVRSLLPAAGFGGVVTALVFWASFRFANAETFIETGHPFGVVFVLFVVALPFLIAGAAEEKSPRRYADLFDVSWGAVTRVIVSAAFTGLFWLLLFLSDALLQLVGITLIEALIDIDPAPPVITGAIFGLAIVVTHELSDMVSPQLVLRLLRLLLPMITVVVTVFVVAIPFRGLSNLFGSLSAGGVMIGMGMTATALVSAAIDRSSEQGVQRRWMKGFVQVLACLVPILGGLAIAAVWVRVLDYGWTPDRLAAATIAGTIFVYGLAYAGSVILRGDWAHRLRQGNIALALGVMAIFALWLTPVLNPQAISARSQVARLDAGEALAKLPVYEMAHEWGRAGAAEISMLKARFEATDESAKLRSISLALEADNSYDFEVGSKQASNNQLAVELDASMPVFPEGSALPSDVFSGTDYQLGEVFDVCLPKDTSGDQDCVLISIPEGENQKAHFVLFSRIREVQQVMWTFTEADAKTTIGPRQYILLSDAAKQDLLKGVYTVGPPRWSSVQIDGENVHLQPWSSPKE